MLDHLALGVSDLAASRAFYEAALAPLGYGVVMEWEDRVAFGPTARPIFFLGAASRCHRRARRLPGRRPASASTRSTPPRSPPGGATTAARDAPQYHPHYYGAFVLDPDGNNAEAVCHTPAMSHPRLPRRRERDDRLPPGQYLERGFPVL